MPRSFASLPFLLLLSILLPGVASLNLTVFTGFGALGRHGVFRRATKASPVTYYSSLVAFGASYTDNAHARPAEYASSLRNYYPYSSAGGRYSNGPVAVEYMVTTTASPALKRSNVKVILLDHAYGGSQIDNSLTSGTSPATKDQVAQYLSDVASGAAGIGAGRVLHYINTGINPLTQIWTTAIAAGMSASAVTQAGKSVTANVNAIAAQMRSISTNSAVYSKVHGADYLIVGIPPLEIVPTFSYQVSGNAKELALLKTLSTQFNTQLKAFAVAFKAEARNGKVFWFDLASLWYSMYSSPTTYGIKVSPATTTCYDSSTGNVCTNPASYLYFDTLHPVTTIHKLLANKLNAVVQAG